MIDGIIPDEKIIEEEMKNAISLKEESRYPEALDAFDGLKFFILKNFDMGTISVRKKFTEIDHQIAVTLQNKALALAEKEKQRPNVKDAISVFLSAISEREMINDNVGVADSCFSMALCMELGGYAKNDVTEAYNLALRKIQATIPEIQWMPLLSVNMRNLGNMLHNVAYISQYKGNFPEAIEEYQEAIKMREEVGDERGLYLTYAKLAECYLEIGNLSNSSLYSREALKFFIKTNNIDQIKQVRKTLSGIENYQCEKEMKDKGLVKCMQCGAWVMPGMGIAQCTNCYAIWEI